MSYFRPLDQYELNTIFDDEAEKVMNFLIKRAILAQPEKQNNSEISIHYDPMIAKVIIWDNDRSSAHRKMTYTLRHLKCLGIKTNQDFLLHLIEHSAIQQGDYNTNYIKNYFNADTFNTKNTFRIEISIQQILENFFVLKFH